MHKFKQGFTLIEVMITIVIIGILAAIAVPSYQAYFTRVNRDLAKQTLFEAAQRVENFYSMNLTYVNSLAGYKGETDFQLHYDLALSAAISTYTLTATPKGAQATDDSCGTLAINHTQTTTAATTGCW
jgi:type IV pilus assembly protein PilE